MLNVCEVSRENTTCCILFLYQSQWVDMGAVIFSLWSKDLADAIQDQTEKLRPTLPPENPTQMDLTTAADYNLP